MYCYFHQSNLIYLQSHMHLRHQIKIQVFTFSSNFIIWIIGCSKQINKVTPLPDAPALPGISLWQMSGTRGADRVKYFRNFAHTSQICSHGPTHKYANWSRHKFSRVPQTKPLFDLNDLHQPPAQMSVTLKCDRHVRDRSWYFGRHGVAPASRRMQLKQLGNI